MDLEHLITTSVASFLVGANVGYSIESNFGALLDFKQQYNKDEGKKHVDARETPRLSVSLIGGSAITLLANQSNDFVSYGSLNALSFYAGEVMGGLLYNIINKRKIPQEELAEIDNYFENIKEMDLQRPYEKIYHEKNAEKITDKLFDINNPALTKYFLEKYDDAVDYSQIKRTIRNVTTENGRDVVIAKKINKKQQEFTAFICMDKNFYSSEMNYNSESMHDQTLIRLQPLTHLSEEELCTTIFDTSKKNPVLITKKEFRMLEARDIIYSYNRCIKKK